MRHVITSVVLITFFVVLASFLLWVSQVTVFTWAMIILMMIASALCGAAGWEAWYKNAAVKRLDRKLMSFPN